MTSFARLSAGSYATAEAGRLKLGNGGSVAIRRRALTGLPETPLAGCRNDLVSLLADAPALRYHPKKNVKWARMMVKCGGTPPNRER